MSVAVWNPFKELEDFFGRYNPMLPSAHNANNGSELSAWAPRVDIRENKTSYVIKAELPEINKEDITVDVENGHLCISGERKSETESNDEKVHRIERHYGQFERIFKLPDNVKENAINATFKDGVLTLQLPKAKADKPKSVSVDIR